MQQIIKRYSWIALLVAGLQISWGFSMLGPLTLANGADNWQTGVIGYNFAYADSFTPGDPVFLGDVGGPRNIAEEYRRNIPNIYYTYDQTFLNFFGTYGASAVDGAYAIMNSIPSADKTDLSQYPLEALHPNFTAQSLFLTDLKSITLHLLVEQLGLADPERFVWTLHDRTQIAPGCPINTVYLVVSRNLDYLTSPLNTIQYSAYINDIFYTYFIVENCTGPNPLAFTVPFSTDPEATPYTAVAANNYDGYGLFFDNLSLVPHTSGGGLQVGWFYNTLTRDDVAGLKYLYRTNNVNLELPDPGSLLFTITTNLNLQQLLPGGGTNVTGTNAFGFYSFDGSVGYGDYGWFLATSVTNGPAVMQALYPGLIITSSSNYFVRATNYTYTQYFAPLGVGTAYPPPLVLVTVTNATPYLLEKFVYKFGNVFPNHLYPNTVVRRQTVTISPSTGSPYPAPPATNTTTQTIIRPGVPSGDFFVLSLFHTNVCPLNILYTGLTNVLAITNLLSTTSTNIVTPTNASAFSAVMFDVTYFTNYTFVTHPVVCAEVANAANLYQGNGGPKFVREDFDSLIGQFFQPVTNYYTLVALTNSQWQVSKFVRVITRPDILMNAADEGQANTFNGSVFRNLAFTPSPILNGLAGPGTINTPSTFTYNKIGESSWNGLPLNTFLTGNTNSFVYQLGEIPSLAWASFDGSTNEPVVYPNGTSIAALEAILANPFSPGMPPDGFLNAYYTQTFTAGFGLVAPLSWSAIGLPPGLSLGNAPDGTSFVISGTPTVSGLFNFILRLTDGTGHTVQWNLSINIH